MKKLNLYGETKRVTTPSDRPDLAITLLALKKESHPVRRIWCRERGAMESWAGPGRARLGWTRQPQLITYQFS